MVHNGIEYGDMELICEAYHLMKELLSLSEDEMHDIFSNMYSDPEEFLPSLPHVGICASDPAFQVRRGV